MPDEVSTLARQNFKCFIKAMKPDYQFGAMHHLLCDTLEKAIRREPGYTRIVVSMPPRHGKSLTISELLPGWAFGQASLKGKVEHCMEISYAASLAFEFGFSVRNMLRSPAYNAIFPECSMLGDEGRDGSMFRLPGGHSYRAFGVDGSITGKPSSLCIVDDPIKNRQQADSPRYISKLQQGFGANVYTRLEPGAVCIIVHTRWNDQDLIGYVLDKYESDGWKYLRLPALADSPDDPLGRKLGEALVPFRYDEEALLKIKANMPVRDWQALYQNDPIAASSTFWVPTYYKEAKPVPPAMRSFVIATWDCADGLSMHGDYTAVSIWTLQGTDSLVMLHCEQMKVDITGLIAKFLELDRDWEVDLHLIEKSHNGIALKQFLDADISVDVNTEFVSPNTRKELEFNLASNAFAKGQVQFAEDATGDAEAMLDQLSKWPGVANDDLAITGLIAVRWFQENWVTNKYTSVLLPKHGKSEKSVMLLSKPYKGRRYGRAFTR